MNTLLLVTLLTMAPAEASAPLDEAAVLYKQGEVLYDSSDYEGAIKKFTEALGLVIANGGTDHARLSLLYNIASAHEKQFAIDKDISHLRQAIELYKRYRTFARTSGDTGDALDIESKVMRLERRLKAHDQMTRNRSATPREAPPPPTPEKKADDRAWKKPRNVGLGLVVGGGAVTVGGVVLAVLGSRYESRAQDQVNELADLDVPPEHPAWTEGDDFIAQEARKGKILMGVGATMAVLGATGVGVGAYYLVKAKKAREGQLSAVPTVAPGLVGVQISGRF